MTEPLLTYFDARGRVEVIQLILEEKAIPYRVKRIALEEWPMLKPTLLLGHLPIYEDGDLVINQSHAIYRHLARKHDLYGKDEKERVRCDIVEETLVDAQNALFGLYWNPNFVQVRDEFEKNELPVILEKLQALFVQNDEGQSYWVGEDLTYVDFCAWYFLDYMRPFSQQTLDRFETLKEFKQRIEARPRIAAYLSSDRRPATLTVAMASFGGTPETS